MNIEYGGLKLKVVKVVEFDRTPVMDDSGTDYLFTKFSGNVLALINGQDITAFPEMGGMSYKRDVTSAGPPINVRPAVNQSPVVTDAVIRHWLTVPRRQLRVTNGEGQVLLSSPRTNAAVDAHNGPFCDVISIQEVMGNARSFIINLQFTTYINECQEAEEKVAPIVSNRFSQHHILDDDYGLSLVTTGTAHFRTDLLYTNLFGRTLRSLNPDSLRRYLFLPIPIGFQRYINYVTGHADGSTVDYQFTDIQKPVQFVVGDEVRATQIESVYRQAVVSGDNPLGVALSTIERAYNIAWAKKGSKDEKKDDGTGSLSYSQRFAKSFAGRYPRTAVKLNRGMKRLRSLFRK